MNNNKLIKYKENIFIRIANFFKKFFFRKNVTITENIVEEPIKNDRTKMDFLENIQIKEDTEEIRLKKLQLLYDNGEIEEEELSEADIEKLVALYEKQTERLNQDTLRRKAHIAQMLQELKNS